MAESAFHPPPTMQLRKLPDGSIRLTLLNPWDVQTFRSLPALADFSKDPKAEKRMLPAPAIDSDLSPEMAIDWVEYVVPELRESFAENLAVVMADLATLTEVPDDPAEDGGADPAMEENRAEQENSGSPGDDSAKSTAPDKSVISEESAGPAVPHFALTIPADHAEAWFRAMNQARIVLSKRYGIDSEHVPELARLLEAGQIEFWFQYELFVSLQGWLVEAVLDPE